MGVVAVAWLMRWVAAFYPLLKECTDSFTDSSVLSIYRNAIRSKVFVGKKCSLSIYEMSNNFGGGSDFVRRKKRRSQIMRCAMDDVKTHLPPGEHQGTAYQATAV